MKSSDPFLELKDHIQQFQLNRSYQRSRFPALIRQRVLKLHSSGCSVKELSENLDLDKTLIRSWIAAPKEPKSKSIRSLAVVDHRPVIKPRVEAKPTSNQSSSSCRLGFCVFIFIWRFDFSFSVKSC